MILLLLSIYIELGICLICKFNETSFYRLLQSDYGGDIIDPHYNNLTLSLLYNQTLSTVNHNRSQLQYMKSYLPITLPHRNHCDDYFSKFMDLWIRSYSNIENDTSIPYRDWNHKQTIGRYVKYGAMIQYKRFQGYQDDTLINFYYNGSLGWPWTDSIDECTGLYSNWNCAFQRFDQISPQLNQTLLSDISTDFDMNTTLSYRHTHRDHVIQVLFYGKILSLVSEPSDLIKKYMAENIVSSNTNKWYNLSDNQSNDITKFQSYDELLEHLTDYGYRNDDGSHFASVSMHVRHGDACDYVVYDLSNHTHWVYEHGKRHRPCFSIDIYLQQLHYLRERYNVRRVYLATDSEEMIQRTRAEARFNWIYLNVSRSSMGTLVWIEKRSDNENRLTLLSTVADMNLLKYGQIFLGVFASHYSTNCYYMMAGHNMRLPPFISIDNSISCTAMDRCPLGGLNTTIEAMILRNLQ